MRPKLNASPPEGTTQHATAAANLLLQRIQGLASEVALDQIVEVRKHTERCHVYNLSTAQGWYFANHIIASNCIHRWQPDDPASSTALIPDGTPLHDGSTASGITMASATAQLLTLADFWMAGMTIVQAMGDQSDQTDEEDD